MTLPTSNKINKNLQEYSYIVLKTVFHGKSIYYLRQLTAQKNISDIIETPKSLKGGRTMKNLKYLIRKLGGVSASLALMVTALNVNTACMLIAHQPKLPKEARKLRKF